MDPKLAAVAGPLKGSFFPLTEEEVFIGRDLSNRVAIADVSVSRRHSHLVREGDSFRIRDLDSLNGTFVNGVPVKDRLLEHSDQIEIGNSLFCFLLHEEEVAGEPSPLEVGEQAAQLGSTLTLRREDALYVRPEKLAAARLEADRIARDFKVLLSASQVVNSSRSLAELGGRLLDLVLEAVPAERGALLLAANDAEELIPIAGRHKLGAAEASVPVSRTVARRVLQDGAAILSNDVLQSEPFRTAESLIAEPVRALAAAPLVAFEKPIGLLYLDTSDPATRFDESHLQLLLGVANLAAAALPQIRQLEWLESERRRLQQDVDIEHNMVGDSAAMRDVYRLIARVAPAGSTILITGESGTGKEMAARAIHANSPRCGKPFVAINCAALTETLLESELFGHERGAFTGAIERKKGKFEVADGGTVFLDEVSELAPALQSKLLRVLQEREFERVGGTRPIRVDIRLIGATNKNLEEAVRTGAFRQDLYYRLNVISLAMPPLRERREDIPLLVSYFTAKYGKKLNKRLSGISPEARPFLLNYDWPGNVRELENAIERAIVLGGGELIRPEDLPEAVLENERAGDAPRARYHEALNETKKQLILKAVEESGGSYTEAAKLLGLHPNYLHRLTRNLGLKAALKK